jgi:transcriptional regulator with XRE-family HTH domain
MQPLSLEQWRRRRPWTQKELAESSGVSVGTVRGIEHGYYKSVRPRVMRAIAGALNLQPADVLEFRPSLGLSPEPPAINLEQESTPDGAAPNHTGFATSGA